MVGFGGSIWLSSLVLALALLISSGRGQVAVTQVYNPPVAAQGKNRSAPQWDNLLGNSLYFYDCQRAGVLPDDFRVPWRHDSVLNDGSDVGLNLSAGYFDAGNFIKVTLPLSWALTEMSWAATLFGRGFEKSNQTPYLDEVLRNGFDWLLAASSLNGTVVAQVGTNTDNYWGPDTSIPANRPSYVVTADKPGTDVVASTAAALAAGAILYSGTALPLSASIDGDNTRHRGSVASSLRDDAYAQTLLSRARSLFDFAQTAQPQQVGQRAASALGKSYPSSDWRDKLVTAGAFLTLATGDAGFVNATLSMYDQLGMPQIGSALNWDTRAPILPVLLTQAAIVHPELGLNTTRFQADAEAWLDSFADGDPDKGSGVSFTKGGLAYFSGYSAQSSLNPALHAAVVALVYASLTSDEDKGSTYLDFAHSQVDYMLGNNPMNAVYVVGQSPNSAENPHSAMASGGTDIGAIDTSPPVEAHVLYGALVGGPDGKDTYYDQRSDYAQTEPALDLQAPLVVLSASQCANSSAALPFYVGLTAARVQPKRHGGAGGGIPEGGKIAIAVIVLVVVFGAAGAIGWWQRDNLRYWWRHKRFGL